jgi:putative transcriptional regulator
MAQPPRFRSCHPRRLLTVLAFVGIGLTALLAGPGHSAEPRPPVIGGLLGQVLVATDDMSDPRFARTVIYMVHHDTDGAQGLVVNRPLREIPLAVLLDQTGIESKGVNEMVRLHVGGPVQTFRIFVLHTADYVGPDTMRVKDGFSLTWNPDILKAIAQGKGPRRKLFIMGYAGWAPGQLEAEMKTGAWVRASADEALVFDNDYDTKWDRAIARRKIDL